MCGTCVTLYERFLPLRSVTVTRSFWWIVRQRVQTAERHAGGGGIAGQIHGAIDAQRTDTLSHEVGIAGDVRVDRGVLQQRLDRRLVELRMLPDAAALRRPPRAARPSRCPAGSAQPVPVPTPARRSRRQEPQIRLERRAAVAGAARGECRDLIIDVGSSAESSVALQSPRRRASAKPSVERDHQARNRDARRRDRPSRSDRCAPRSRRRCRRRSRARRRSEPRGTCR